MNFFFFSLFFSFCENNRKSDKIMHCVDFFFLVVVVKTGPYYGHFSRFFRSKLSIYLQIYKKNGHIFKNANQKKNFNTVHNLITLSIVFTNFFFFFSSKIFMYLYSKTFYIPNFKKKKKILVKYTKY